METFSIIPLKGGAVIQMQLYKLRLPKRIRTPHVNEMMVDFHENGQKEPITVEGKLVIDGIARCLAAIALGWEEIEVRV